MSGYRREPPLPIVSDGGIDPRVFFETAYEIFRTAEGGAGNSCRQLISIGGVTIALRFANPALIPFLTKALEHVFVRDNGNPSLTICIWDDASSNTPMPPPPWSDYTVHNSSGSTQSVYTRRGDVRGYNNDCIFTAYNWGADVLNMMDNEKGLALYWTHDARRLPSYELSAPFRTIFHWAVTKHGGQLIHAAAVGAKNGGILLAGKGGSGKSTAALSCLNSDLLYVSDDYCMFFTEPEPYVHSIYSSAKVDADNLLRVPHAIRALSNKESLDKEKAVFFLSEHFSEKIVSGFPILGILLPKITGRIETRVTPATPTDAMRALALSTMSQLAGAHQVSIKKITELVNQVPCYHLELGTELREIPIAISDFLTHR